MLQVPAPACQFGRIGLPHGAVRAWTVVYVNRGLARKPRYARRRPQGLKLQLNRGRPAAQHVHRSRGATGASPSRRFGASHIDPA